VEDALDALEQILELDQTAPGMAAPALPAGSEDDHEGTADRFLNFFDRKVRPDADRSPAARW
jgi:hypothetical protein